MTNPYFDPSYLPSFAASLGSSFASNYNTGNLNAGGGFGQTLNSAFGGAATGAQVAGVPGAILGAGAGAITSSLGRIEGVNRGIKNLNTNVDATAYTPNGQPVYNSQPIQQAYGEIGDLNKTANWDSTNILGMRSKANRKRSQLINNIKSAQNSYNSSEATYRNRMQQQQQYFDRMQDRSYNLYS
jgi:hypothetical protein